MSILGIIQRCNPDTGTRYWQLPLEFTRLADQGGRGGSE